MSNERDLMAWLEQHRPAVACSLMYCTDLDEVRRLLNHHTGLVIAPGDDREHGFRRWLQALSRDNMRTFEVQRPVYRKTGEKFISPEGQTLEWCEAEMVTHAIVLAEDEIDAMEVANREHPPGHFKKCYSWVLSEIKKIH